MIGAQHINATDIQTKRLGGPNGSRAFFRRNLHRFGTSTAMQVGAELTLRSTPLHRCDNLPSDYQRTNIAAAGLSDEFLRHNIDARPTESLDH